MKYEVNLPDSVDQRLSEKASQTGKDVVQLICMAVARFVEEESPGKANGDWSEEIETCRRRLIDRDIAGTITADEREKLAHLDRLANEHFDIVAPAPMEGAQRLHRQLLQRRGNKP
ncbi:MAG: hypothetical protein HUU20_12280 [Pirellulales bacterium]|nr:hypothetical protein [Pirellulales bacterium]